HLPEQARRRALELQPQALVLARSIDDVIRRVQTEIENFRGERWACDRALLVYVLDRLTEAIHELERFDERQDTTRLWTQVAEGSRAAGNHAGCVRRTAPGDGGGGSGRGRGLGRSRALECIALAMGYLEHTDPQFLGDLRYVFDEVKRRVAEGYDGQSSDMSA